MNFEKQSWDQALNGQMSIIRLRELYLPAEEYRFAENSHPARSHFLEAVSVPCVVFVLKGSCTYTDGKSSIILAEGEFADIGKGSYTCDIGDDGVRFVRVIRLPRHVRK